MLKLLCTGAPRHGLVISASHTHDLLNCRDTVLNQSPQETHALARVDTPSGSLSIAPGRLALLMEARALHCVFQPIADLRSGSIFGHEALIRGPANTAWHRPDALLAMAQQEELLQEFELFCVQTALEQWGRLGEPGRLFVNISADALVHAVSQQGPESLLDAARRCGVSPRMLVLEITEHERVGDMALLHQTVRHIHAAGVTLALDDFGDGRSSLRLWSEVKPAYVKIDKYFTRELGERTECLQVVHALKGIAEVFGSVLIAEGIETRDDLRMLRDVGIPYGQGYLLGLPEQAVHKEILAQALEVIQDSRVSVLPQLQQTSRPGVLRHLPVIQAPAADLHTSNNELAEMFKMRPELHAMAVVDQGRPVALINRQQFMNHYATLYFREVHGRKPCLAYANHSPRVVELDYDVDELVGILTSQDQRYLSDGFIVTDNGRYVGLGTGDQLVRSVTEARIEAARHANPLTFLPGNIPISMHIDRLLESGTEFVACYADLNNFKPFNDLYGYWRGDEMIRLVARLCVQHCDARRDFVGHVGGDDFMILFQSSNWQRRCEQIVEEFATEALNLFDEAARQAGGIRAEDRHGVMRFFPCTTLSIGAVRIQRGDFRSAEQVANEAALAKHEAKHQGSGLHIRLRQGQ